MLSFIDRQFKAYGIKAHGEETMERLTDPEIEKARCYAFPYWMNARKNMAVSLKEPLNLFSAGKWLKC